MNARESVGIALDALRANKLRSVLTLLGVIIGVSSVIAVMSLVQGLNHYVSAQLVQAGTDVFTIDKVGVEFDFQKVTEKLRRRDLTPDDAEAVGRAPHVQAAVAERSATGSLRWRSRGLKQVAVRGEPTGYLEVNDLPVDRGRPLTAEDERGHAAVCVVGDEVADYLFGPVDAVGRDVRLGDFPLTVVGIGKRKGSSFGASQDMYVLIPFGTFERLYGRDQSVTISVRSLGPGSFNQAQDEARAILRARRHVAPGAPDDFEIVTPEMYLSLWRNLSGAIFVVIVGVSLISLIVGGIVIMNIMLVSVTERTREIGVRKALGATRSNILMQFLVEALVLCLVGGTVGVVLGSLGAVVLSKFAHWNTAISPFSIALAFFFSAVVGLFFGIWPARRAAMLDPIEALRYE